MKRWYIVALTALMTIMATVIAIAGDCNMN